MKKSLFKIYYILKYSRLLFFDFIIVIIRKNIFSLNLDSYGKSIINVINNFYYTQISILGKNDDFFYLEPLAKTKIAIRRGVNSDFLVVNQIYIERELDGLKKYFSLFQNQKLKIIDAGANIGLSAVYLSNTLFKSKSCSIILIEPDKSNVAIAEINMRLNNIEDFSIENAGLFNKDCYLKIFNDFRDGDKWSLRVEESIEKTSLKSVEIFSLINKYQWSEIDILKIDIEGSERYLLEDPEYFIRLILITKIILIELHEEYVNVEFVKNIFIKNGFTLNYSGEYLIAARRFVI
jgi:FkbM family methyltransferase